jgi:hypothetical protein
VHHFLQSQCLKSREETRALLNPAAPIPLFKQPQYPKLTETIILMLTTFYSDLQFQEHPPPRPQYIKVREIL